ncbi:MAG: IclR family transcriptional regulator [Solirubrobacteraceae bacterium]
MNTAPGEARSSIVDRVFCVIESCADSGRPLTLVDLSGRTGLPKTTLHRVCWKLVQLGLLDHGPDGFQVGSKLFALGSMSPELRRLRALAMPRLHELVARTGWATNLAILSDQRALVVEEVYSASTRGMRRMVGGRLPLHATAIGKALLSGFGDLELEAFLGDGLLRPYTRTTVVRPNLLRKQLAAVRCSGVAISHEEWSLGTSGVGAPVSEHGVVVAAIAVVGPPDETAMREHPKHVRLAASQLSRTLEPAREAAVA